MVVVLVVVGAAVDLPPGCPTAGQGAHTNNYIDTQLTTCRGCARSSAATKDSRRTLCKDCSAHYSLKDPGSSNLPHSTRTWIPYSTPLTLHVLKPESPGVPTPASLSTYPGETLEEPTGGIV